MKKDCAEKIFTRNLSLGKVNRNVETVIPVRQTVAMHEVTG